MEIKARIFPLGCEFLLPYLEPSGCMTADPRAADFILAANNTREGFLGELQQIRALKKPLAWWTIEDPNWFDAFLDQARAADFVFTADEACIPQYQQRLGHSRVFWLPLACSPEFHRAEPQAPDAAEFVISANWYGNQARLWSVDTVVEPLRKTNRDLALFCYENFMWPESYRRYWRGRTHYRTVADQYRQGRVVLGVNNQRSGLDGRDRTVMTSMRTFEALACGKPFLAAHSDAYEHLGLRHGEHLASVSTPAETLEWADRMLGPEGQSMAAAGREHVHQHHTYAHRLAEVAKRVDAISTHSYLPAALQQENRKMTYEEQVERTEERMKTLKLKPGGLSGALSLAKEHDNGNMRYPELLALAEAMLSHKWKPGQYACEIGTFHGRTAAFLGRVADLAKLPCRIISVDSFESPYLEHLCEPSSEYYRTMAGFGLFPHRNMVVGMRSSDASEFMPEGIGLLIVDGGHDREACLADLNSYSSKIGAGGILAVDDIWYDSVRQATDEFVAANPQFQQVLALEKIEIYRRSS